MANSDSIDDNSDCFKIRCTGTSHLKHSISTLERINAHALLPDEAVALLKKGATERHRPPDFLARISPSARRALCRL
jgi:hypothetical protein